MHTLRSILMATRPKTLPAGLVAVWAGCLVVARFAAAYPGYHIALNGRLATFTALSCMCIQIACNLFNDALDAGHRADTERRQGPLRITAAGRLSPTAVKIWGAAFLLLAALAALPLITVRGIGVILIGLPCMLCAYAYTGGPFPLAYRGLGELFVLLFFGLVGVIGTVYVQIDWQPRYIVIYAAAAMLGIVCGLLSCVLLEVNNIRDRAEDATTGKRTLAVRLGEKRARALAMSFLVAPYAVLRPMSEILPGVKWNWCWPCSVLISGLLLYKLSHTPADRRMNALLGLASLQMLLYLLSLTLG